MDRIKKFCRPEQSYEPIAGSTVEEELQREDLREAQSFSWTEYLIFLMLGVGMLWAWNMLLAAGPYFQSRFESSPWLLRNFQAAELSVSSITNLGTMLILSKMQTNASYPRRIMIALIMNIVAFTLLAMSTWLFLDIGARGYFAFLIVIVFMTSLASAFCQNGVFAFVSGFGQSRYTQGIMAGQGVAGVLPCVAQIVSVMSVMRAPPPRRGGSSPDRPQDPPSDPPPVPGEAAFAYFLTATIISVLTLIAFVYLLYRNKIRQQKPSHEDLSASMDISNRKSVPLTVLFRKLAWLASGVFFTFVVTMSFPVFTQQVISVQDPATAPALLQPPSFIPLAFLFWNTGDLVGRLIPAVPRLSLTSRPKIVFLLALSRVIFIPLYHLCNLRGQGAVINSDVFYLFVVQLLFGVSNGYIGSICMMGAGEWVDPEEREAAGGFMGLCLVAGLAVGSLASFFAARS